MAAPLSHALAYLYATNSARPARAPSAGGAGRRLPRRAFDRALRRAASGVTKRHPKWADALFDEHFLTRRAAPLLYEGYRRSLPPGPAALAREWAAQFGAHQAAKRQRGADALIPAAADFLARLSVEIARLG
jgi:hypothetical protein